ncbi:hypothetical protein ACFOY2_54360 [Nonomuraea purpurea]|uniref:Uncharacterized protein n=1 Tax=Nonomuraea purpurea TaxID=1849276 RepID=A0ABV8GQK4_9ACTN
MTRGQRAIQPLQAELRSHGVETSISYLGGRPRLDATTLAVWTDEHGGEVRWAIGDPVDPAPGEATSHAPVGETEEAARRIGEQLSELECGHVTSAAESAR